MIMPPSRNNTRSATCRAKPISWVTHNMVMPLPASLTITSSTSLTISGSRAEVGSSNNMILGSIHSARAIATRCCWPPESWLGYLSAWLAMPTFSRKCWASSTAFLRGNPRTDIGARMQLSSTLMCGNRLKCWNTMPISLRTLAASRLGCDRSVLLTRIWPFSAISRRLMQRIKVDLPEPDGPHRTIRSPSCTFRSMPLSTWNAL